MLMGRVATIFVTLVLVSIAGAVGLAVVLPRMNWSAIGEPSEAEEKATDYVLGGWLTRSAGNEHNPVPETPDNLELGRTAYDGHCSGCHGLDGSGHNRLGADFYPSIPKLTGDTQDMSDGQLYFIVRKGIRYTAMPAFEKGHQPKELWEIILWVRHLAHLTPKEKAEIEAEAKPASPEHQH